MLRNNLEGLHEYQFSCKRFRVLPSFEIVSIQGSLCVGFVNSAVVSSASTVVQLLCNCCFRWSENTDGKIIFNGVARPFCKRAVVGDKRNSL